MATRAREHAGRIAGLALAPVTQTISRIRHARMFHPRGMVLDADVRPCAVDEPWASIARRLEGKALVRLSSAWWMQREWPDVLGCAIRFRSAESSAQDLLFATIRRPWTMPFAPMTTKHHDFFANHYYAVSPFRAEGTAALTEWRVRPQHAPPETGGTREEKLARAVERREAIFVLEARPYRRLVDLRSSEYHALAVIDLTGWAEVDQERLSFDPFRSGLGIEPAGFVHALRVAAYAASRRGRSAS
jgi:hypothetical protein